MKFFKSALIFSFLTICSAHADQLKCSSTGELLPQNKIDFQVKLSTSSSEVKAGLYKYKDLSNQIKEGTFSCENPNERGLIFCKTTLADEQIQNIVVHPVLGLMFQIKDQNHPVSFHCESVKGEDKVCGTVSLEKTRYDGNKSIFRATYLNKNLVVMLVAQNDQVSNFLNSLELDQPKEICIKGFASDQIKYDSPRDFYVMSINP